LNNHTRGEDKRNFFYMVTAAVIAAMKPKGFIIENVPNVINDKSLVVESSKAVLRQSGYVLSEATLAADSLGWAQTRRRHFLIGSLTGKVVNLPWLFESSKRTSMPVSKILAKGSRLATDPDVMNTDPQMSKENTERIAWLFENDKFELPNSERPDCHKEGHTYPSVYGRMRPNEPAPTLTTGFMSPGRGRFIHPFERRTIRPREAARIQGFPDTFVFDTLGTNLTKSMLAKWIGDAVPSILGFLPSNAVLNSILRD
jgi:DNA (cytosine-5)-methyltransferase 1